MIIVNLSSGLGNQMFQYALGRCLAEKRQDSLVLYTGSLEESRSTWSYGLSVFQIDAPLVSEHKALRRMGADVLWTAEALTPGFCSTVFSAPPANIMLRGKWQSESYFRDIESTIRAVFCPDKISLTDESLEFSQQIGAGPSVCVHVRRADHLSPRRDKAFARKEYYGSAIALIRERVQDPHFFIFSDDIAWCIENLAFEEPHTFVPCTPWPEDCAAEHLRLMSLCRHFIIANSAFSWWAAWLASNPAKVVVAPKRWFKNDPAYGNSIPSDSSSDTIVPASWNRI